MIKQVQIIGYKEFMTIDLDQDKEVFVVHITLLSLDSKILINAVQKA